METKLAYQLENLIRQIVRDEIDVIINEGLINEERLEQIGDKLISISSKIGWLKGEKPLLKFYELLISHGFISCDFEIFKPHFIGSEKVTESVKWLTYTKHLVYLFDQLIICKFIPENNKPHQLLKEHFIDMRGHNPNNGCLRSLLNDVRNNKRILIIDNIISQLYEN